MGINCYLCGGDNISNRKGEVRDNKNIRIKQCEECGLVFLNKEENNIDLTSFYKNGGMHGSPEKCISVNQWRQDSERDDRRRSDFLREQIRGKTILDFGCGVGGFLLFSRQLAKAIYGIELESRLEQYFHSLNLDVRSKIEDFSLDIKFDVITAFHVIEHLSDPRVLLRDLSKRLTDNGKIFIEVPSADDALLTLYDNDAFSRFTYWSCHLYLFNVQTLKMLASQAGLRIAYIKNIQRYPLSNHLYWLSNGKPGGHDVWGFLDNQDIIIGYENALASIGKTDTIMACFTR